jgi:hypothetical protein
MKYYLLLFLLFVLEVQSQPIIDYVKINQWCSQMNLTDSEQNILKNYFQATKLLAQNCIKNHHWLHSQEGKSLENELNGLADEIMKNQNLVPAFQQFELVLKEEIEQKNHGENQHTFYYTILELVADGCLACLN